MSKTHRPTHHLFIPSNDGPWSYVGSAWDIGEGRYNIVVKRPIVAGTKVQLRKAKARPEASAPAPTAKAAAPASAPSAIADTPIDHPALMTF
jgi:hypothetical protein